MRQRDFFFIYFFISSLIVSIILENLCLWTVFLVSKQVLAFLPYAESKSADRNEDNNRPDLLSLTRTRSSHATKRRRAERICQTAYYAVDKDNNQSIKMTKFKTTDSYNPKSADARDFLSRVSIQERHHFTAATNHTAKWFA